MAKEEDFSNFFHVLHSKPDGKWYVREREGVVFSFNSKEEAVKKATELAESNQEGRKHVVIHKADGAFEMPAKLFHVLHSKHDGKWHIKEGSGGTIDAFASKDEAIAKATKLAVAAADLRKQVIIHKTNGAFEAIKTFY